MPKPIAKITQDYVAIDASEYVDSIYKSTEKELPYLLRFVDEKSQIEAMVNIIEKKKMKNVGILLPNNDCVMSLIKSFSDIGFDCEYKYKTGDVSTEDNLDFRTNKPKVMTYHSAKGLQFETVILPFYEGAISKNRRKALYVAMTRSYRFLYIMYSGNELKEPLKSVPTHLYTTKL